VEKPKLVEILREWGKKRLEGKPAIFKTLFGEDKVLAAYENNEKVVFKCVDQIIAELLQRKYAEALKEVFKKPVKFSF